MATQMEDSALGAEKPSRAFVTTRFILELDGAEVGVLVSADGGHFKSEPIGQQVGYEGLVTRYPGRQKFDEVTISVGTSMAATFWDWMQSAIDTKPKRKNGAIVALDFDGKERARRTFTDALISEIQFPALDAKAKSPAFITVKFAPEMMTYTAKGGQRGRVGVSLKQQKQYVPANYEIRLDRFGNSMTNKHIVKVDPITIKQNIIINPIGKEKFARVEAGRVDHPTISMHVPETYAKPWLAWWKSFVGDVEHDPGNETTAAITYLASDCSTRLLSLSFTGVGISGCTFDKHDGGSDAIRNVKIDLYTETMKFSPSG